VEKAALINQATGKMPHLFSMLETCVRNGKLEPREASKEHHSVDIPPQVAISWGSWKK
jgi:hypothetical protein